MKEKKLIDTSQAPGLVGYVIMAYINGVFAIINLTAVFSFSLSLLGILTLLWVVIPIGQVISAIGIANELKVGYNSAIAFSWANLALLIFIVFHYHTGLPILTLLLDIIMIIFLLNRRSKEYINMWFH